MTRLLGLFAAAIAAAALVIGAQAHGRIDSIDDRPDTTTTTAVVRSQGGEPSPPRGASQRRVRQPGGGVCIEVNGHQVRTGTAEAARLHGKPCPSASVKP